MSDFSATNDAWPSGLWLPYTLSDMLPEEMQTIAEALTTAAEQIGTGLEAAGAIMVANGALLSQNADLVGMDLESIIQNAESYVRDLTNTGVYFTHYEPHGFGDAFKWANTEQHDRDYVYVGNGQYDFDFDGDGKPDRYVAKIPGSGAYGKADEAIQLDAYLAQVQTELRKFASVSEWCGAVAESIYDTGDPYRPQFETGRIGAVALLAVAPNFSEFMAPMQIVLDLLFGLDITFKDYQTTSSWPNGGSGQDPNWTSAKLADIPGVSKMARILISVIDTIRPMTSGLGMASGFGQMLQRKGQQLAQLGTQLETLLTALSTALAQTGFYALKIDVTGGNQAFYDALTNTSNAPDFGGLDQVVGGIMLLVGTGSDVALNASIDVLFNIFFPPPP